MSEIPITPAPAEELTTTRDTHEDAETIKNTLDPPIVSMSGLSAPQHSRDVTFESVIVRNTDDNERSTFDADLEPHIEFDTDKKEELESGDIDDEFILARKRISSLVPPSLAMPRDSDVSIISTISEFDGQHKKNPTFIELSACPESKVDTLPPPIDMHSRKLSSISSIGATSPRRRQSRVFPPPTPVKKDSQKVFFYLALSTIFIALAAYIINMTLALIFTDSCELWSPKGKFTPTEFMFCSLINANTAYYCVGGEESADFEPWQFFFTGLITVLVPNMFGTLWQFWWKSKLPDLSVLSSRERTASRDVSGFFANRFTNRKRLRSWFFLGAICAAALVMEFAVDNTHFCRHQPWGRYVYCVVVIITGLLITKLVQIVTQFEHKEYLDGSLSDELVLSAMRTTIFHRDVILVLFNTTVAIYLPSFQRMPGAFTDDLDAAVRYSEYVSMSVMEATFFLWSAILSSQCLALSVELAMRWTHTKIQNIPESQRNRVMILLSPFAELSVHGLYLTHENWYLLIVLFLFSCGFAWLNPNLLLLSAGTLIFLSLIYKIRFKLLNPQVTKQFIPHMVREESLSYMYYLFIPIQFLVLLPFGRYCGAMVLTLPIFSFGLTIAAVLFYNFFLRQTRIPYVASITQRWRRSTASDMKDFIANTDNNDTQTHTTQMHTAQTDDPFMASKHSRSISAPSDNRGASSTTSSSSQSNLKDRTAIHRNHPLSVSMSGAQSGAPKPTREGRSKLATYSTDLSSISAEADDAVVVALSPTLTIAESGVESAAKTRIVTNVLSEERSRDRRESRTCSDDDNYIIPGPP